LIPEPLVDLSALDRVNGSLHMLPTSHESGALRYEPITLVSAVAGGKGDLGVSGRGRRMIWERPERVAADLEGFVGVRTS
jgi:hypothetical protein